MKDSDKQRAEQQHVARARLLSNCGCMYASDYAPPPDVGLLLRDSVSTELC